MSGTCQRVINVTLDSQLLIYWLCSFSSRCPRLWTKKRKNEKVTRSRLQKNWSHHHMQSTSKLISGDGGSALALLTRQVRHHHHCLLSFIVTQHTHTEWEHRHNSHRRHLCSPKMPPSDSGRHCSTSSSSSSTENESVFAEMQKCSWEQSWEQSWSERKRELCRSNSSSSGMAEVWVSDRSEQHQQQQKH